MRVVIVSGIWPPDIGGPATHAPELAEHLTGHGHAVVVVTTADAPPAVAGYPIHHVARSVSPGLRHLLVVREIARAARRADVVYATSMLGRAALASRLARRPLVAKITGDEAYERAKRRGLFTGDLDAFQRHRGGPVLAALRAVRTLSVRRASHVFCPSAYLRDAAIGWGLPAGAVEVLPNPAPDARGVPPRAEARATLGVGEDAGFVIGFAGRLTTAKALDVLLDALVALPNATLLLAGNGPDRDELAAQARRLGLEDRVRFLGGLQRDGVLRVFRAADVAVLPSRWENFPHSVVEALATGTPVVASAVGGVLEIVDDGVNGLLVPAGDVDALAGALRRTRDDTALRAALAAAAAPSVERFSLEAVYGRIEQALAAAAA
jgi:glycosyltransferase involved in cell wall biosynthesis